MKKIIEAKLCFSWDDNKAEFMYENLPEYLFNEINEYLKELEQHREEVGDDYNFCDDQVKRGNND
jgi:hypothetical protein